MVEQHESLKGEVAVMISGLSESGEVKFDISDLRQRLKDELRAGKRFKEVLKDHKNSGLSRQDLYKLLISIKEEVRED